MESKKLGEHIATLRRERHMTQTKLADRLYVTEKAVSKWGADYPILKDTETGSQPRLPVFSYRFPQGYSGPHESDGNSHGGQPPPYRQPIGGELPWSGTNL